MTSSPPTLTPDASPAVEIRSAVPAAMGRDLVPALEDAVPAKASVWIPLVLCPGHGGRPAPWRGSHRHLRRRRPPPRRLIAIAGPVKDTTAAALHPLRDEGIEVVMLTGDKPGQRRGVARRLGIDRVEAEVLPDHKSDVVQRL